MVQQWITSTFLLFLFFLLRKDVVDNGACEWRAGNVCFMEMAERIVSGLCRGGKKVAKITIWFRVGRLRCGMGGRQRIWMAFEQTKDDWVWVAHDVHSKRTQQTLGIIWPGNGWVYRIRILLLLLLLYCWFCRINTMLLISRPLFQSDSGNNTYCVYKYIRMNGSNRGVFIASLESRIMGIIARLTVIRAIRWINEKVLPM